MTNMDSRWREGEEPPSYPIHWGWFGWLGWYTHNQAVLAAKERNAVMVEVRTLALRKSVAKQLRVVDPSHALLKGMLVKPHATKIVQDDHVIGTVDTDALGFGQGYYVLVQIGDQPLLVRGVPYSWSENLPRIVLT